MVPETVVIGVSEKRCECPRVKASRHEALNPPNGTPFDGAGLVPRGLYHPAITIGFHATRRQKIEDVEVV